MTKIPSVEERVIKFQKEFWEISGESAFDLARKQDAYVTQALQAQRDAGTREERARIRATLPKFTIGKCFSCEECSCRMKYKDGFNSAIRQVDELLSSLEEIINPTH